jgi:hypothetical protein
MTMGMNQPRIGYNSVTEFMGSGLPWVISGTAGTNAVSYKFDKIAKHIIIANHESAGKYLRVGFTLNGINGAEGNYFFRVDGGNTFEFDARIKEIYLKRDGSNDISFSMYAELVGIDAMMMPQLTGSVGGTPFWNGVG